MLNGNNDKLVAVNKSNKTQTTETKPPVAKPAGIGDVFKKVTGIDVKAVTKKAKEIADTVIKKAPTVIKAVEKWNALPSWVQNVAKKIFSSGTGNTSVNNSGGGSNNNSATFQGSTTSSHLNK